MRLEKRQQEELNKRKGLATRTVLMTIWLAICFAIAYFIAGYLFEGGYLSENLFYNDLRIPRSVSANGLKIIVSIAIVIVMQIVFSFGFVLASPEGRRRTGDATLHSRNKDPFDDGHY